MMKKTIAIGSDHGGLELKNQLVDHLSRQGHRVRDCGTDSTQTVDYPRYAYAVARLVALRDCDRGIVVDGAGIGSCMAANKVRGVRAAACYNQALARNAREHNDANVLTLGAGQTRLEAARKIVDTFLQTDCSEDRHRRRVALIMDIEKGPIEAPKAPATPRASATPEVPLSPEDARRVSERVRQLMAGSGIRSSGPISMGISPARLAKYIDHTLLKPDAAGADIETLCREAVDHGFYSVCVNSANVRTAKNCLRGSDVKLCSVVGFPLGAMPAEVKAMEARKAIREGADEIDMVINVGALKSGNYTAVLADIRAVVEACRERKVLCKVILETALLIDEEKVRACQLSMRAGADFVKTSTGFSSGGATPEDVSLMYSVVAPKGLQVKASGGIRSYADALRMIEAGATRLGASSGLRIIDEARAAADGREHTPGANAKGAY